MHCMRLGLINSGTLSAVAKRSMVGIHWVMVTKAVIIHRENLALTAIVPRTRFSIQKNDIKSFFIQLPFLLETLLKLSEYVIETKSKLSIMKRFSKNVFTDYLATNLCNRFFHLDVIFSCCRSCLKMCVYKDYYWTGRTYSHCYILTLSNYYQEN